VLISQYRKRHPLGLAFLNAYESRPLLHLRADKTRRYSVLTFVEAVTQEQPPSHDDLQAAYRIAGSKFIGKLKRLFIVLDDDYAVKLQAKGSSGKFNKGKRRLSTDGPSTKKRVPSTQ
jgi:hypothetical protein